MRYLGGKTRLAKNIVGVVAENYGGVPALVWDPFCGGLSTACAFAKAGSVVACSDAHPALISLYRAIRAGWRPPTEISEELYKKALDLPVDVPLHGFCAFGCAFGGIYKTTIARSPGRNYAEETLRALDRDVPVPAAFGLMSFFALEPRPFDGVIYCDPPYQGTTGYAGTPEFEHDRFFERCEEWERSGVPVYVSEYEIQREGWLPIWEKEYKPGLRGKAKTKTDRVYRWTKQ